MRKLFLICSAVFTLWSCNRGEDDVINNPDAILEKSVKSYSVKNLKAGETNTKEGVVYYSLLNNKQIPYAEVKEDNWDLAFAAGGRMVSVYANSKAGGVAVLDAEYEKVKEIPTDINWITEKREIGILLDWGKYLKYTGAPEHVLLAENGKTIVVKTGDGKHYAKIKVKTIYGEEENPTKKDWSNMGNFTFDYAIQTKAGKTSFEN